MICDDKYCNDILIQLSAIKNSVKSLSNHILEKHIHSCIENDLKNNDTSSMEEVIELFKKYIWSFLYLFNYFFRFTYSRKIE